MGKALERRLCLCSMILAGLVVLANSVLLWPEVAAARPLNDDVLHFTLTQHLAQAMRQGGNILDPWIPYWTMGFPVFHYYPPLPHLVTAAVLVATPLDPLWVYNCIKFVLLCLFPMAIYLAARNFGFQETDSWLAAATAPWISTNGLYGLDYNSYLWIGYGLYAQLFGMILLPLALGRIYVSLRKGRRYLAAAVLLGALVLCHAVYAYMALLTSGVFLFAMDSGTGWRQRVLRLLRILVPALSLSVFYWLPHLLDRQFLNRSIWVSSWKYDSFGAAYVLGELLKGNLFDFNRMPVFSLTLGVGLAMAIWKGDSVARLLAALFGLWMLLFFGRPTWGVLANLWPLAGELHLHRFIGAVHLFGLLLAGWGLAALLRRILGDGSRRWALILAVLLVLAVFWPAGLERYSYFQANRRAIESSEQESQPRKPAIEATLKEFANAQGNVPGRIYAGMGNNWGREFTVGSVPFYAYLPLEKTDSLGYLYHAMALVSDLQVLFKEERFFYYDLFNVRYLVGPQRHSFPQYVKLEKSFPEWNLWSAATTGYFSLVRSTIAYSGDKSHFYEANLQWLGSQYLAAKNHPAFFLGSGNAPRPGSFRAVLNAGHPDPLPTLPESERRPPQGVIVSQRVEGDRYHASVSADEPAVVLLKVSYHPNWHAVVDGGETELLLLSPGFMGIRIGAGRHEVVFRYQPGPLKAILLIVGVLGAVLLLFIPQITSRLARS